MASKRNELPDLQRQLLEAAISAHRGKIWLPRGAMDSLPTTYSALLSLQRRKLIEAERAKDPEILSWKITKAGKDAVAPPKASRSRPQKLGPAVGTAARNAGSEAATPQSAGRNARQAPVTSSEASRSRAAIAKKSAPPAKPGASPAKKPSSSPKRTGGRGRT